VYKLKRGADGKVARYKARWVVKGFHQREGIDYDETFAPTGKQSTFRTMIALVAARNLELGGADIKTAFLHGEMDAEVYMQQPEGYEEPGSGGACRLLKTRYGLKQAPRAWALKLKAALAGMGFTPSAEDPGMFTGTLKGEQVWMVTWVDDLVIAAKSKQTIAELIRRITAMFDARDLGEPDMFIGIQITRDRAKGTIKLSQMRATDDIIAQYGIDERCEGTGDPFCYLAEAGKGRG
jgi:hypothetical protein